jgi:hypothetical protein
MTKYLDFTAVDDSASKRSARLVASGGTRTRISRLVMTRLYPVDLLTPLLNPAVLVKEQESISERLSDD